MEFHRVVTADAHFDLALDIERKRAFGRTRIIEQDYLQSFREAELGIVVSSIFVQNMYIPEMALRMALRQVAAIRKDIGESNSHLALCTSWAEIQEAIKENKVALLLSFEDCLPLGYDFDLLPLFYDLGVRLMGLSWSRRNAACDGASLGKDQGKSAGGLTRFGVELVKECDRLGMLLDVSHINEKGFWDVCEVTDRCLIASHSNCRRLVDKERNLSDDQIREVSRRGGFIGVNGMSFLISEKESAADLEALCDHICHIAEIGGIECVGFGFDFNDQILAYIPQQEQALARVPCRDVLKGHGEVPLLIDALKRRGFQPQEIAKIQGENFMRTLEHCLE